MKRRIKLNRVIKRVKGIAFTLLYIGIYYSDCSLSIADNDEKCKKCNDITFNSVLNIIDKHIKEIEQERTMAAEPIKAELNPKGQ